MSILKDKGFRRFLVYLLFIALSFIAGYKWGYLRGQANALEDSIQRVNSKKT